MRRPTSIGGARVGVALSAVLSLALVLEASDAAAAPFHDWWLEPSRTCVEVGDAIDVSAFVGVAFRGDRVKRNPKAPNAIVRFQASDAQGTMEVGEVSGEPSADPLGRFVARANGTTIVAWQSRPVPLYLRAHEFEAYLHEEGLEAIVALRAERGESRKMGLERYSRCAKALLQVGPDAKLTDRAIGLPLELVLENMKDGEPARAASFQLTFHEQPLAGVLVMALERDHPAELLKARSDAEGRVKFELPRAGFWLVKAVHMIEVVEAQPDVGAESHAEARLDWESFWASLTFELLAEAKESAAQASGAAQ